jgi:hypothetical protein
MSNVLRKAKNLEIKSLDKEEELYVLYKNLVPSLVIPCTRITEDNLRKTNSWYSHPSIVELEISTLEILFLEKGSKVQDIFTVIWNKKNLYIAKGINDYLTSLMNTQMNVDEAARIFALSLTRGRK